MWRLSSRGCPWGSHHRSSCRRFPWCLQQLLWWWNWWRQSWVGGSSGFWRQVFGGMFCCRVFACDHQGRAVSSECSLVGIHKIRARLLGFPQNKAMSILIPYPHMVTRMEFWKFNSTMSLVKAELLVQSIRTFFHFHCLALFGLYIRYKFFGWIGSCVRRRRPISNSLGERPFCRGVDL